MKKIIICSIIICLTILMNACNSYFNDTGNNTYTFSKNGGNLIISKPLTDENISHFYDLPQVTKYNKVSIVPPVN